MKEKTSSGISQLHFGHLKACSQNTFLSDFEATLSHIPYYSRLSLDVWKKCVNVMLQKKRKSNHVSCLHTICLFEADNNFNNKILGRNIINTMEANDLIPKEQYGSRKGKKAILHAVNKKLLYDNVHLQRKPAILCSNDAKSNYDRILHSIASITCEWLGIPPQPITCMLTTIQELEHHIRTAYGTSTSSMCNLLPIPLQYVCQGNGAGPAIWITASSPLLEMICDAGHGISFEEPLSKITDNIVGFAFMDDTDLVSGDLTLIDLTFDDVANSMQEAIDRWEGRFKAT